MTWFRSFPEAGSPTPAGSGEFLTTVLWSDQNGWGLSGHSHPPRGCMGIDSAMRLFSHAARLLIPLSVTNIWKLSRGFTVAGDERKLECDR
jgi:hypothetical protein